MGEPQDRQRALLSSRLRDARTALRLRSGRSLCSIRAVAAAAFLLLAAWLGLVRGAADWRVLVPTLAGYAAVAAALWVLARTEGPAQRALQLAPALDVLVVFALQFSSLRVSPFPAGVAGWSLGPFVLLVLLASQTLNPALVGATALLAWICELLLQRAAGVGFGAIAASGLVLAAAAASTRFAVQRLDALLRRVVEEEVEARLHAAENEELQKNREELRTLHGALERKHAELLAAQAEAEQLAGSLVHDLKAPLANVVALLQLAAEEVQAGRSSARTVQDLAVAEREANRMTGMVNDLVAISRLEQGLLKVEPERLPLHPFLSELQRAYGVEAQRRGFDLRISAPGDLAARFDSQLTRRVLDNLVSNAVRYLRSGNRLEVEARGHDGVAEVIVRNDGPAIADERRARLFERFATSGRVPHQAGLGLYFCKLALEAQRGSIRHDSSPQWPVQFVMALPV